MVTTRPLLMSGAVSPLTGVTGQGQTHRKDRRPLLAAVENPEEEILKQKFYSWLEHVRH